MTCKPINPEAMAYTDEGTPIVVHMPANDKPPLLARIPEIAVGALMAGLLVYNASTVQNMELVVTEIKGDIELVIAAQAAADTLSRGDMRRLENQYNEHERNIATIWPRLREMQTNIERIAEKVGITLTWRSN